MQKLHLVGFTTDLDGLIFSARKGSKAGGYMVPLDKALLATIAEAERLRNGDKGDEGNGARGRARPDSRLTPREIQAHLRAGRSIPEVAAEAGVDIDWVERFAVPVVAEQTQMVERARGLTYSKPRLGQSTQPLGTSVRWNLADKGVAIAEEAFDLGWSAFQLQDDVWMVRFRYTSRGRLQVAEWELDLDARSLHSRNRLASELGYVEKGRRPPALPTPSPPRPAAAPPVVETSTPADAEEDVPRAVTPRRRRSRARRTTARRPSRKATKKKATARKATARKSTAKKSTPKKSTPKKSTPKRSTAKKSAAKRVSAKKASTKRTSTKRASTKKATAATKRSSRATSARRATATRTRATATKRRPASVARASKKRAPAKRPATLASPPSEAPADAPAPTKRPAKRRPAAAGAARTAAPARTGAERAAPTRAARRERPVRPAGPRIAGATAREAVATKRSGHAAVRSRRGQPPASRPLSRDDIGATDAADADADAGAAVPQLSGPLARSLLARRLQARKAAQGDGDRRPQRPLRVR